jgi:hypothetical protein
MLEAPIKPSVQITYIIITISKDVVNGCVPSASGRKV